MGAGVQGEACEGVPEGVKRLAVRMEGRVFQLCNAKFCAVYNKAVEKIIRMIIIIEGGAIRRCRL